MPILESALGSRTPSPSPPASDRIAGLTLGLEDYTADLGVAKTAKARRRLYARMRVVNAAHAARVQAIDSVFGDVADCRGLLTGASARGPWALKAWAAFILSQIEVIHRAFAPSAQELEKAQTYCRRLSKRRKRAASAWSALARR